MILKADGAPFMEVGVASDLPPGALSWGWIPLVVPIGPEPRAEQLRAAWDRRIERDCQRLAEYLSTDLFASGLVDQYGRPLR